MLTDVCPHTLGVDTAREITHERLERGLFSPIIDRNSTVPVSRVERYYPMRDGQDAFLRDFALHSGGHPRELVAWLETVDALYNIDFKHGVAEVLLDWLAHDDDAPMLGSSQYEDLDRFFSFDFSSLLAPMGAARWAIARERTERYGERSPTAIRQLKRPFGWTRALLIGAVPGMNRRLGLLASSLVRDFGGLPPGIAPRQCAWFTRLADPAYLGRERWLSVAASSALWGVATGVIALPAFLSTGGVELLLLSLMAVATLMAAAIQTTIVLARYLRDLSRTSERLDWWLGAGVPLGLALLALLATGLSNPAPSLLCAVFALFLAARHRSRIFDAIRLLLASLWLLVAAGAPAEHLPELTVALAAVAFVALDSAHALRHSLPFQATVGNRWTRIGSYAALGLVLVVKLALPLVRL